MTAAQREALREHVAALVASAPPLRPEQRDRLAVLLRPAPVRPAPPARTPRPAQKIGTPQPARVRRARTSGGVR